MVSQKHTHAQKKWQVACMKTKLIVANEFFDHHEYMEHPTDLAELC